MSDADLLEYYARRAVEYDEIYDKPERQRDIAVLKEDVKRLVDGHRVLEVACGTGYWTALISEVCDHVIATDACFEVLQVAKRRSPSIAAVHFVAADAYRLDCIKGGFTAGFAGFWWSHVPKDHLGAFLSGFHRRLRPGALVCFADNKYVDSSSTPLSHTDERGNSFQRRRLKDGTEYEVVKNFPTPEELRYIVAPWTTDSVVKELRYYWLLSYSLTSA